MHTPHASIQLLLVTLAMALTPTPRLAASETRPVTFDDIMSMKNPGSAVMAPDGKSVVFTIQKWIDFNNQDGTEDSNTKPKRISHLYRAQTGADRARPQQLTRGDRGESRPAFSPDGRWIAFVSARGNDEDAPAQLWLLPTDGGEAHRLSGILPERDMENDAVQSYAFSPDSKQIAFVARQRTPARDEKKTKRGDDEAKYEDDFRRARLWMAEIDSRQTRQLPLPESLHVKGRPSWSNNASRLVFTASPTPMIRDSRDDVFILDLAEAHLETISNNFGPDSSPVWSPDGRRIAFVSTPNDSEPLPDGTPIQALGNSHLMLYDVERRRLKDVSSPEFDRSPGSPTWFPDSSALLLSVGDSVYRRAFAYDVATRNYRALSGDYLVGLSAQPFDESGKRVAFTIESATDPPEIAVSSSNFASPRQITSVNSQARELQLGATELIHWTSDDFSVEGLLTLPVGHNPNKRYPLMVVVHGGPTGAHVNNFRVRYGDGGQHWASNGWAVFYPNPRGSTNYGEDFTRANLSDWGGGDFRDVLAGVDSLVERGIADPDRLAIQGWSYGGYMTCWTVSQTTRFKAAMMGAALTNLTSMYGTNDIPNYLGTFFGGTLSPETAELYRQRSGLTHADSVRTPTLILHGGRDERVPIGQPMEFFRALKDRGVSTELVFYPREGHGLREYHHQIDRLERQFEWITRHTLGTDAEQTNDR